MIPLLSLLLPGFFILDLASPATTDGSMENLISGNTDFAAKLYQVVAGRTDANVCLSPLALSIALSALLSATSGTTREQLLQGLGLTGLDPQALPGTTASREGLFPPVNVVVFAFRSVPDSEDRRPAGPQPETGRGCSPFQQL